MFTRWYSPRQVDQLASDEIAYTGRILNDISTNYNSVEPLTSVARSQGGVLQTGGRSLVFRDFGITDPGTVQGIELELIVERLSRTQDRTVQLWQNRALGKNRADLSAEDRWLYGSDLRTFWRVTDAIDVRDPTFGILIDLQPHSQYPSRDTARIRSVKIRIDFH